MSSIELRITAVSTSESPRDFDESQPFFIDAFSPVSAAGILTQLRQMSAIKSYVHEHCICANADRLPTIISPLNELGEFSISLPSNDQGSQVFTIRVVNQNKQFGSVFSDGL